MGDYFRFISVEKGEFSIISGIVTHLLNYLVHRSETCASSNHVDFVELFFLNVSTFKLSVDFNSSTSKIF